MRQPPPDRRPYRPMSADGPELRTTTDNYRQRWRQVGWWGQSGALYALDEQLALHEGASFMPLWALIEEDPTDAIVCGPPGPLSQQERDAIDELRRVCREAAQQRTEAGR